VKSKAANVILLAYSSNDQIATRYLPESCDRRGLERVTNKKSAIAPTLYSKDNSFVLLAYIYVVEIRRAR
jgi:hypothetical protein